MRRTAGGLIRYNVKGVGTALLFDLEEDLIEIDILTDDPHLNNYNHAVYHCLSEEYVVFEGHKPIEEESCLRELFPVNFVYCS